MPSGRTVPGMRGRCGRVTRRSGRRSPSAPPHQGWGTTGSATHTHRRGSGSGLRFSFAWVGWYESIVRGGEGHLVPRCASSSGGDQDGILPAGILQDLSVGDIQSTLGRCLQDRIAALISDLIDGVESTVGSRVVAHGVRLIELNVL
jgi:hypothetical protein